MRRKLIASPESYENFSIKDIENTDAISDKTILEKLSILLLETST